MYRKILFITLLLPVFLFSQEKQNNFSVHTNYSGSSIFINGEEFGTGSLETYLQPGKYSIEIRLNKFEWNSEIIRDTIEVGDNKTVSKSYNFGSNLYLQSNPEDAYVFSDNKLIGHTPLFVSKGIKNLTLVKPDYIEKFIELKQRTNSLKIEMEFSGTEPNQAFRKSPWFDVLIGTAVILGGTAAYYKIEADKNYDRYLETNEAAYMDKTDKYDTISGVAFGVLQINFGFILYYLLVD